nr:hypothetical protein [Morchella crassipes]
MKRFYLKWEKEKLKKLKQKLVPAPPLSDSPLSFSERGRAAPPLASPPYGGTLLPPLLHQRSRFYHIYVYIYNKTYNSCCTVEEGGGEREFCLVFFWTWFFFLLFFFFPPWWVPARREREKRERGS